jgi:DeoR/GlpR family transcriptional regulator of sugar metabolism
MAEVDATSRRLLAVLPDAPAGLSKRKAAELAGVNPETARQRIAKLEAAGLVTVNGVVKTTNSPSELIWQKAPSELSFWDNQTRTQEPSRAQEVCGASDE